MKKFLLMVVAVACFGSCTKENVEVPSKGGRVEIIASAKSATRTTLDGANVKWTAGDKISVNGVESEEAVLHNGGASARFGEECNPSAGMKQEQLDGYITTFHSWPGVQMSTSLALPSQMSIQAKTLAPQLCRQIAT